MNGQDQKKALLEAIRGGDLDTARGLLDAGVDARMTFGPESNSLMHAAAQNGDIAAMELLLEFKVDINVLNTWNRNALHFAAAAGQVDAVDFLLAEGCNAAQRTINGFSPAATASESRQPETLKQLVAHRETQGSVPARERDGLRQMAIIMDCAEIVAFCLDHWPVDDINERDGQGMALLHWAAHNGSANVARLLIQRGANDALDCGDGRTMMDFAQNTPVEAVLIESARLREEVSLNNSRKLARVYKGLRSQGARPRM